MIGFLQKFQSNEWNIGRIPIMSGRWADWISIFVRLENTNSSQIGKGI